MNPSFLISLKDSKMKLKYPLMIPVLERYMGKDTL